MTVWGITTGQAGMVAQVRALAVALGVAVEMKTVTLKKPWSFLPNIFYASFLNRFILSCALSEKFPAQMPDVLISCGRKAALVALALKLKYPHIKTIHIQDPQMPSRFFDIVVAMAHDKITGGNVIKTTFALHSITPQMLAEARATFAAQFATYPSPKMAVLLGGSTNKYTLTRARMEAVIEVLEGYVAKGASLLITPSRRTGEENIALLKSRLGANGKVYIYDFAGENPYLGLLACADEIIVSNDSVNMMSEAYVTGKKLHILNFEGHANTKPANFAIMLKARQTLAENEMPALAQAIKERLALA